jgi:DNA-binding NtrC family response regulator
MVQEGSFREDLYHRLNVLSLHVPPLRERKEDLQPLIEHFLRKYSSLSQSPVSGVNADFLGAVRQMKLSGNARQLENIITRALVNAAGKSSMSLNDLTSAEWQQLSSDESSVRAITNESDSTSPQTGFAQILDLNDWNLSKSLDYCECALLKCALQFTHGNQTQTARLMGITPRSVYNKIQKYKLHYH